MNVKLVNENYQTDYVNNLLKERGVTDLNEFFNPTERSIQDPANLKNIEIASVLYMRIVLKERPRILLIVDPDADGFTSAAIFYLYTKQVNIHCQIDYLLHEGKAHGLSDHIDNLMNQDISYDLIVCPDSSSNDKGYHDMLSEINIPCLVLDHHIIDSELSDNAIVVNNQYSPNYYNKDLSGAGVVFQFCRYIDKKINQNWANEFIDLAALGIVGDMMDVRQLENRYIIKTGLSNIKNVFFRQLLEKQAYSITGDSAPAWERIVEKTNPISIAFYIVPLINAVIRVGTMEEKEMMFRAFLDGNELVPSKKRGARGELEKIGVEVARIATNCRAHQNKILDQAILMAEAKIFKYDLLENQILIIRLEDEDFPSELNGLLAMQLSAKYKKPTMVLRMCEDGYDKGSMRGLNQSELKDFKSFLEESGMFEYVAGHANAAGAAIADQRLADFHKWANNALKDYDFGEKWYDVNFERDAQSADLMNLIQDLTKVNGIWGQGTPEPLIYIKNITILPSEIQKMGAAKDTVKITKNGISYMKFHAKDLINDIEKCDGRLKLNIIGRANLNEWMGRISYQIFIDDYEIITENLEF